MSLSIIFLFIPLTYSSISKVRISLTYLWFFWSRPFIPSLRTAEAIVQLTSIVIVFYLTLVLCSAYTTKSSIWRNTTTKFVFMDLIVEQATTNGMWIWEPYCNKVSYLHLLERKKSNQFIELQWAYIALQHYFVQNTKYNPSQHHRLPNS